MLEMAFHVSTPRYLICTTSIYLIRCLGVNLYICQIRIANYKSEREADETRVIFA